MEYDKKDAKKDMLKKISEKAKEAMNEGRGELLEGKMKVVVSSDSPEGIKEGLSKAEQLMKMKFGDEDDSEEKKEKKEKAE